jgi:hypothetical protein
MSYRVSVSSSSSSSYSSSSSSSGPVSLCPGCNSALGLLCNPKYSHQYRFNNPVPLIKRHRSLTEAVLISFGSVSSAYFVLTIKLILQTKTFTRNMPIPSSGQIHRDGGCITSQSSVSFSRITEVTDYTTEIQTHQKGHYMEVRHVVHGVERFK